MEYTLITDTDELAEMVEAVRGASEVAVDTESDGLFVYYEKVCLIQILGNGRCFLIDPLVTGDLSPLNQIFSDPNVLKIFHAAEYDIICMKRDFGFEFANIFDTMIAARTLGKPVLGLGPLLEHEYGIHLDKQYQKSNWGLRPLSEKMLQYGAHDTRYLFRLKECLRAELAEIGRLDIAEEDFARLCKVPAGSAEPNPTMWWNVGGSTQLGARQQAMLHMLCVMREESAQKRDIPAYKVISNAALMEIVKNEPRTEGALAKLPGVGTIATKRYGAEILNIVRNANISRDIPRPVSYQRPCNGILQRKDRLHDWRKEKGIEMGLSSDVILPKDIMDRISVLGPATLEALAEIMAEVPARYRRWGEELLHVSTGTGEEEAVCVESHALNECN